MKKQALQEQFVFASQAELKAYINDPNGACRKSKRLIIQASDNITVVPALREWVEKVEISNCKNVRGLTAARDCISLYSLRVFSCPAFKLPHVPPRLSDLRIHDCKLVKKLNLKAFGGYLNLQGLPNLHLKVELGLQVWVQIRGCKGLKLNSWTFEKGSFECSV
jgi:hypothetical protein